MPDPYDSALADITEAISIASRLKLHGISWTNQGHRQHRTFATAEERDWFWLISLDGRFVYDVFVWSTFRHGDPIATLTAHIQLDKESDSKHLAAF